MWRPGSRKAAVRGYLYLQHHVGVVVGLDVIEADDSRQVGGPIVGSVQFALLVQPRNVLLRERWLQHILWKKSKGTKESLHARPSLCWRLTFITVPEHDEVVLILI